MEQRTLGVEAVILSLDPAKHRSGATILVPDYGNPLLDEEEHPFRGDYVIAEFGKVESQGERRRYLEAAVEYAEEAPQPLPVVVVAEEWDPPRDRRVRGPGGRFYLLKDQKWTYTTILGIGEGWGLWQAEIHAINESFAEDGLPSIPVLRVTPNEWQLLYGPHRPKDTEARKATACRWFEAVFGYKAADDIAEAACIGLWATQAPAVREVVETYNAAYMAAVRKLEAAAKKKRAAKKPRKKKTPR